jgi:hypothetical protein
VDVLVYDYDGKPVTPGMNVGVTAAPVYQSSSLGGTIQGGTIAVDTRFKIFTTITGGKISFTYTAPSLAASQSGTGYIQVVEVDDTGQVVGLIGSASVTLSGSTGYTAPQPSVVSVSPANGQSGVGLNVPIIAQFSQSLDPSTVNSTNFSITKGGTAVTGTLTLSDGVYGSKTIVTFVPTNPWSPNTSYTIYLNTSIKSSSGNPLLQYSNTSFSTGTVLADTVPPFVVNVNPPDGSSSVATNASISVQFSQYMSPTSINGASLHLSGATGNISGKVVGSGSSFSFIPDGLLAPNTQHTLTIENTVSDIAGNHMASAFTSTFATQTGTDTYPAVITNVSPSNGTTGVPPTNPIVITFSESMNPITLSSGNCYINDNSSNAVPSTIGLSAGGTQVTITPIQPLFANASYSINITTGAQDVAGNSLASALSSSFTTALAPGTGTLPTAATITINPTTLFANGEIATTVTVSNINVNGTLVPNGTPIAVTAAPAYKPTSVGGTISGPSIGTSVDTRFILFATEGAGFTCYYTPPALDSLTPGATASGIIQVAAIDSSSRPSTLIVQGTATLYGLKTATVTPSPASLSANGASQSIVDVMVTDNAGNLAPDGTQIGITVAPVFVANSAGGTILGGTQSGADYRVKTFSTTGGHVTLTYQAPSSRGPGYAVVQAVTVNNQGAPTGLLGSATINLN